MTLSFEFQGLMGGKMGSSITSPEWAVVLHETSEDGTLVDFTSGDSTSTTGEFFNI